MPFPSALNSGQLESLRGTSSIPATYSAEQYMVLGSNTTVFAARVNGTPTGNSFAQVTFDTVTTGAYTDLEAGMTVLISHTNDRRAAFFTGRVRKTPTSSILYVNETSEGVLDNDYIFVLRDFRVWEKLARVSGGTYYKDWELTYTSPAPVIYGLQSAYAGIVSGSPAGFTVAFAASAFAVTSGATISSYAYTIPSGGTVTAGATNTANVTVRFDASATEYWVKLIVTDSGSRTATRWIPVWAVPADLSTTVALGFEGVNIAGSLDSGWTASVNAFDGVSTVLDNTLAVAFEVERYNGTATTIVSSVKMVGRLRTEQNSNRGDETYNRVQEAQYEIESPLQQLMRTATPLIEMRQDTSPTVWDEINNLTPWRAVCHLLQAHTTFLSVNSLSFSDVTNGFLYNAFSTQGSSILDSINDILESVNGVMEAATCGETRIVRDARWLTSSERTALVTVASFGVEDALDFSLDYQHLQKVGQIKAYAGAYNSTSKKTVAVAAMWPGAAQASGFERSVLGRQILTSTTNKAAAQAELNRLIGYYAAIENTRARLQVDMPDGYNWIVPSAYQWYTWTLPATETTGGRAFDTSTRWLCESVSVQHDHATGAKSVSVTFIAETPSTDGKTYNPPVVAQPALPGIPPINAYPSFPDLNIVIPPSVDPIDMPPYMGPISVINPVLVPTTGDGLIEWTADTQQVTQDFLMGGASPTWNEVVPTLNGTIRNAARGFGTEAYILESDDTNSWVWYTDDVFAPAPEWTMSEEIEGVYSLIKPTSTAGSVYIYGKLNGDDGESTTFDFVNDGDGGWTVYTGGVFNHGHHVDGVGWQYTDAMAAGDMYRGLAIQITFPSSTMSEIETVFDYTRGTAGISITNTGWRVQADATILGSIQVGLIPTPITSYHREWVGSITATSVIFYLFCDADSTVPYAPTGNAVVRTIKIWWDGLSPFAATTNTRFSSDYGATWSDPEQVSPAVLEGGFDTIRIGTQALAASADQVYIAEDLGDPYSAYGDPMPAGSLPSCIVIPRYQFGSTTTGNTATDTPQYLVASSALSDDDEAMWKVTSSGTTFTDITPVISSEYGLAVSQNCVAMNLFDGSRIIAILDFDGTRHLVTSTNAGGTWTDRGAVDEAADCPRFRPGDRSGRQIFFANGDQIGYSSNFGATIVYKDAPTDDDQLGLEVYG